MSDATIFEFPYNLFIMQRMEFVVICQDHLAANVMRVIESEMIRLKETWQEKLAVAIEEKRIPPREPGAYWVRLSLAQIIAKLYMYDSGKLKKPEKSEDEDKEAWEEYRRKKALSISRGTLRKAIDLLEERGFLLSRSKPGDEYGPTLYTLHRENVQKAIEKLPENPFAIFHSLKGVTEFEPPSPDHQNEPPPPEFEPGELQNLNLPPSRNGHPQVQILEDNKDITKDTDQTKKDRMNYSASTEIAGVKAHVTEVLHDAHQMSDSYSQQSNGCAMPIGYMNPADSQSSACSEGDLPEIDLLNYFTLFDFSQEWSIRAVRDLAAHILPAHVRSQLELPMCSQALDTCARTLFANRQLRERGLRQLAALLCFENDPSCPSELSRRFEDFEDPTKEIRMRVLCYNPRMLPNALREIGKERWWPDYLADPPVEQQPIIDLDRLAGTRNGFGEEEARAWLNDLGSLLAPHGYAVHAVGSRYDDRSWTIEIGHPEMSCVISFAAGWQWDLILEAEGASKSLGSPSFLAYLAAALRTAPAREKVEVAG